MGIVHEYHEKSNRNTLTKGDGPSARAAEIAAALGARVREVLAYLFPEGRVVGQEFCVGSLRGEAGNSLKVHLNGKGHVWCDFATGDAGRDLLALWAQARCGGSTGKAMREARNWLGMRDPPRGNTSLKEEWVYHDAAGNPWIRVQRCDLPDGGKSFYPFNLKADRKIKKGGAQLPKERPLFNLHLLTDAEKVYFFEGEKCAAAATHYGLISTTTMGGALSPHKTDFAPLANKTVIIWPDNDEP